VKKIILGFFGVIGILICLMVVVMLFTDLIFPGESEESAALKAGRTLDQPDLINTTIVTASDVDKIVLFSNDKTGIYRFKTEFTEENAEVISIGDTAVWNVSYYPVTGSSSKTAYRVYNGEWSVTYECVDFEDYPRNELLQAAYSQLGDTGGDFFWQWYGYSQRVSWCAVFVSWCANEAGLLNTEIPKFDYCPTGAQWFIDNGEWLDNEEEPESGMVIFFDCNQNGSPDHVGLVDIVQDGMVYTIEGNSKDSVRYKCYSLDSDMIYGYGTV
jgi:hypothetical protein